MAALPAASAESDGEVLGAGLVGPPSPGRSATELAKLAPPATPSSEPEDFACVVCENKYADNSFNTDKGATRTTRFAGHCPACSIAWRNLEKQCVEDGLAEWIASVKTGDLVKYTAILRDYTRTVPPPGKGKKRNKFDVVQYQETSKEKKSSKLRVGWEAMTFGRYCQFHMSLPEPDNMTLPDCRMAWSRDLSDKDVEHEKMEVFVRKSGKREVREHVYVQAHFVS
jgi:hypothetical protein